MFKTNKQYRRHDLSMPFGEMSKQEFKELKDSIKNSGYDSRHPVVIFDDGILDGFHRAKACMELKIDFPIEVFQGTREEAEVFVLSENFARRHLTKRQKIAVFVYRNVLLPMKKRLTAREIEDRSGVSHNYGTEIKEFTKIAETRPDLVQKIAAGELSGPAVVREVLRKQPAFNNDTRSMVVKDNGVTFTVRSKKVVRRFRQMQNKHGMTLNQATAKAFETFIEWAEKTDYVSKL